jgi:hypothetical protein
MEIVSYTMRVPIPGGAMVRIPVFIAIMPAGSSPIQGSRVPSQQDSE